MSIATLTHLNFRGEAREALEFYASVFGGGSEVTTYGDFGMPEDQPDADKVVFGMAFAEDGFRVLAYDIPTQADTSPRSTGPTRRENGLTLTEDPFFLSVGGDTVEELQGPWDKLSDGGDVIEAFGPVQWAAAFGMVTDRFGVTWLFNVAKS